MTHKSDDGKSKSKKLKNISARVEDEIKDSLVNISNGIKMSQSDVIRLTMQILCIGGEKQAIMILQIFMKFKDAET